MNVVIFIAVFLGVSVGYEVLNTPREILACLKNTEKVVCGSDFGTNPKRYCCDPFEKDYTACRGSSNVCSDELETLGEKGEYLLMKSSEDCKNTMFTVNEEEGVSINIDYIPEDLACILQVENKGNYSSSLRFIEEDYHNFDAYVFEKNSYHSKFEPRGHFSFSNSTTPTQNDFHIWYDNTSFIILTVKDPNQGPGHFKSTAVPLPAPEEDTLKSQLYPPKIPNFLSKILKFLPKFLNKIKFY
ncbi:unnamed protein product [Moneuplotes crassus]|uniref:Uncharacterized protein n=1 Tax=Euplotes crassus TaxID=5936 RepID=A0AAD1URE7_EUPCR|nr:unnamed protein product [Moneuplotes crassus]